MTTPIITDESLINKIRKIPKGERSVILRFGNVAYFVKVCDAELIEKETEGYKNCREFYPVPKLIGILNADTEGYLIYEYEESISKERGLLVDFFANQSGDISELEGVLAMYTVAFQASLGRGLGSSARIFFEDRVSTRLQDFYTEEFCSRKHGFVLNGQKFNVSLGSHIQEIKDFFQENTEKWYVVSQCDPNDLNIGIKPLLLDLTAGGKVPIWAEFATLFWYQLAQGGHLSLVYNAKAFEDHRAIFNNRDLLTYDGSVVTHLPIPLRRVFISIYIEQVLSPIWDQIGTKDWYREFKNYLAMKILGVFDVSKMTTPDMLLSLGYLELFYDTPAPSHPRDLLKLFPYDESR